MTIKLKFHENWRGCLGHFLRIDMEWPTKQPSSSEKHLSVPGFSGRPPRAIHRKIDALGK